MKRITAILLACCASFAACNRDNEITRIEDDGSDTRCIVFEYTPAPGQFINENFTAATTDEACAYAEQRLNAETLSYVSLGAFGGRLIVGFGRSIPCGGDGAYDFEIFGNAFNGASEPGIVWVMQDENGNGLPDDRWYELRGSEWDDDRTVYDYSVTYHRPATSADAISWSDNLGGSGEIPRIAQHRQESYYPAWIATDSYTLSGTRLRTNIYADPDLSTEEGEYWVWDSFGWGYVDNIGTNDNRFRISDAMNADHTPANLTSIDFIMVQTAVQGASGGLGEVSTEVTRFRDLHYKTGNRL
ncbi:MAG: hypothetical protein K2J33_02225 [Alistipes sp.]|nr:hypothetical protein [Alistipes sp.]